jgi:uncharacterized membrane protein
MVTPTLAHAPVFSWAWRYQARQYVKGSLWLVPLLGGLLGVALATVDAAMESRVDLPASMQYAPGTASGVLTTIVGAVVGLFGFAVTISVLVVQMATGTLSPRFMRLWYRDRLQKLVFASFMFTLGFTFRLLHLVDEQSVPNLGVSIAGILVSTCLLLLLLYLNRFVRNLRPVAIGAIVARQGLLEARAAKTAAARHPRIARISRVATLEHAGPLAAIVALDRGGGAIQAVDIARLITLAARADCCFELTFAVGDFVTVGTPLIKVYGPGPPPPACALLAAVALGHERSIEDDPSFALRIIVDVAIRALSPAVNDPTTGVQLVNQAEVLLRGLLPYLNNARFLVAADGTGQVRLTARARTFTDYLQLAVTEIRQYGANSPQICRRLRAMLTELAEHCAPECRPAVLAELAQLDRIVDANFTDPVELAFARTPDKQGIGSPPHDAEAAGPG